ncbi:MAG TPA: HD domain-containing protein [Cryomorphaceae bacterium]|nr:HD domain-containing protein [Cryomorphaceae bacterium]
MNKEKAIAYILDRLGKGLSSDLKYHSLGHSLEVIRSTKFLASKEGVSETDLSLLETAAAYHDSGFLLSHDDHEEVGCEIVQKELPAFGYSQEQIESIKGMIMATQIPQAPETQLEKIICDGDLKYLGGERYFELAEKLYEELKLTGYHLSSEKWLDLQIDFLEGHRYWTDYAKDVLSPNKILVLNRLKSQKLAN